MRDVVVHRSGLEIDLSAPTAEDERILRRIHDEGHTPRGELRCRAHGGDLYLVKRQRDATMWAAHWPGTADNYPRHSIALMTPEHRAQVEYMERAADRAGLPTVTEVTLPTRVRPDLIVAGHTAFEAQRSGITIALIKSRTTKAIRGGMRTTTWVSDAEKAPPWMGAVPAVRVFAGSWLRLPSPGEAEVRGGLVRLDRKRCTWREWPTGCPERRGPNCGQWHISRERANNTTLDDLTVGLAMGVYAPVRIGGHAFIAPSVEVDKFDAPRWEPPSTTARGLRPADRVECQADRLDAVVPTPEAGEALCPAARPVPSAPQRGVCGHWIGSERRPCLSSSAISEYLSGWRCENHSPEAIRRVTA